MMYEPKSIGGRALILLDNSRKSTTELHKDYEVRFGCVPLTLFRKELFIMLRSSFVYRDDIGRWLCTGGVSGLSAN